MLCAPWYRSRLQVVNNKIRILSLLRRDREEGNEESLKRRRDPSMAAMHHAL